MDPGGARPNDLDSRPQLRWPYSSRIIRGAYRKMPSLPPYPNVSCRWTNRRQTSKRLASRRLGLPPSGPWWRELSDARTVAHNLQRRLLMPATPTPSTPLPTSPNCLPSVRRALRERPPTRPALDLDDAFFERPAAGGRFLPHKRSLYISPKLSFVAGQFLLKPKSLLLPTPGALFRCTVALGVRPLLSRLAGCMVDLIRYSFDLRDTPPRLTDTWTRLPP